MRIAQIFNADCIIILISPRIVFIFSYFIVNYFPTLYFFLFFSYIIN